MLKNTLNASLAMLLALGTPVIAAESTEGRTNAASQAETTIDATDEGAAVDVRPRSKIAQRDPSVDRNFPDRAQSTTREEARPEGTRGDKMEYDHPLRGAEFVRWFAVKNHVMTSLARLGEERAESPTIRALATQLMTDHERIDEKLGTLAKSLNIELKEDKDLDSKSVKVIDRLENEPRVNFDAAYLREIDRLHNRLHARLEQAAGDATQPEIQAWAKELLPTISEHHERARAIAKENQIKLDEPGMKADEPKKPAEGTKAPADKPVVSPPSPEKAP
jgi:predicted outer membrane protein